VGTTLTICGDAYLGGTAFFIRDLGGELLKLEARDVTGRRGTDVIVRRKQSVGDAERQYIEVLSALSSTAEPVVTFAHEIEVRQSDKHIDNAVRLGRGQIEVSVEPPTNWDALSYKEPIASDVEPILLPGRRARTDVQVRRLEVRERQGGHAAGPDAVHVRHLLWQRRRRRGPRAGAPARAPTPKVARGAT